MVGARTRCPSKWAHFFANQHGRKYTSSKRKSGHLERSNRGSVVQTTPRFSACVCVRVYMWALSRKHTQLHARRHRTATKGDATRVRGPSHPVYDRTVDGCRRPANRGPTQPRLTGACYSLAFFSSARRSPQPPRYRIVSPRAQKTRTQKERERERKKEAERETARREDKDRRAKQTAKQRWRTLSERAKDAKTKDTPVSINFHLHPARPARPLVKYLVRLPDIYWPIGHFRLL